MVPRQMAVKAGVWKNNWAAHCFNVNAQAKKSCQSSALLHAQRGSGSGRPEAEHQRKAGSPWAKSSGSEGAAESPVRY